MQSVSLPPDENTRLEALRAYQILDTKPELAFDRLTRLGAKVFEAPIVLVSLVDQNRQWFKSCYGLSVNETGRDVSFCAHAIFTNDPFVIADALADPRFHDNPLVTGEPKIRFYAGAPLIAPNGARIGTFCVIDHHPRKSMSSEDLETLCDFSSLVVEELELRRTARELADTDQDLREVNARLQEQTQRAEEASRLKTDFLSNMSHELRTPLNAIIGFTELLADGKAGPLTDRQHKFLANMLLSGRHLLHLINDMLDLAKIEAGKLEFDREFFSAEAVIGDVVESLRCLADLKQIELAHDSFGKMNELYLDPGRFKQVVYNYVSNAIKFTPENGRVVVAVSNSGDGRVRLDVTDTGIGIAPENMAKLFQRFQQFDTGPSKRYPGTGLGLALVKRLVEYEGGRVEVSSTLGTGSCFSAIFPVSQR